MLFVIVDLVNVVNMVDNSFNGTYELYEEGEQIVPSDWINDR